MNQKKIMNAEFTNDLSADAMGYFGWTTMDIDNKKYYTKPRRDVKPIKILPSLSNFNTQDASSSRNIKILEYDNN